MYLSNPAAYDAMPATVSYDSLKQGVMDPGYVLVRNPNDETAMEAARRYFTTIEPPQGTHIPDVMMDLHWGLGYYLVNPETQDPAKIPYQNNCIRRRWHSLHFPVCLSLHQ
ncbi:hypothetical protein [Chitinophaga pinensis]|uniref:Uncharacterized protein n=1 Tax=Chitinophaga pinensis TaxID=79329 RepID=A0A5C6LLB7_9BACT|nr:hypothetical protein [Chitinophaga pinensis]TWV95113.1 hypothetical protein FEF09_24905 [Chitinophaga pinensis]